jgi:hypothetical protein
MMISPYVRGVAVSRAHDLCDEAARARQISAARAYKRATRRCTRHT